MTTSTMEATATVANGEKHKYALVWQKVNRLPMVRWGDDGEVEEIVLEPDASLEGGDAKADAMRLRSEFILGLSDKDMVYMELGGVGNVAAMMMHYRGVRVMRIPPKRLKDARAGNDKADDAQIMRDLAVNHPEWFYEMSATDAKVSELKELVHYLYTMQRRVRIPMTLRLIAIERDRILLDLVKAGKDASIVPTTEQVAEAAGVDPDEANLLPESDTGPVEEPVVIEVDEEESGGKGKAKKGRKSKISPETAAIIERLKAKLADNPNLKAAIEQETKLEKDIAKLMKGLAVWTDVFEPIDGIGPRIGGRLIAFLSDPRRFEGKTLFHSCGNMMAYCGWTVGVDGRAQRMRRDVRLNYHVEIRQALFNWYSCVLKMAGNPAKKRPASPWRLLFDQMRTQQRDGWVLPTGVRVASYAEKRVADTLGKPEEIGRFVTEVHLRKRLNKALVEVLGDDKGKEFKSGKKDKEEIDNKLLAFLTDQTNVESVRAIFMRVFNPDEWKIHVMRRAMRKLVKALLTLIYHKWSKAVGAPFDQTEIDRVQKMLDDAVAASQ